MAELIFNVDAMLFLADHRNVFLTKFFLVASFVDEIEGYILIVTLVYVMYDKTLAVRLSVLVLVTMCLNHVLKIIIKNPRPFIRKGTYLQKSAVSTNNAKALATEYSTLFRHRVSGSC
jgi:hypothetical protein